MVLTVSDFVLLFLGIIGSIFAGIMSSLYVQRKVKKGDTDEIINNVKDVIKEELEVNLASLGIEDLTTTVVDTTEPASTSNEGDSKFLTVGDTTNTIFTVMVVSSFESAVKSGNYILLDKELRKDISEVYALMNIANSHTYLLTQLTFVIKTTSLDQVNFEKVFQKQKDNLAEKHSDLILRIEPLIQKIINSPIQKRSFFSCLRRNKN